MWQTAKNAYPMLLAVFFNQYSCFWLLFLIVDLAVMFLHRTITCFLSITCFTYSIIDTFPCINDCCWFSLAPLSTLLQESTSNVSNVWIIFKQTPVVRLSNDVQAPTENNKRFFSLYLRCNRACPPADQSYIMIDNLCWVNISRGSILYQIKKKTDNHF